MTERQQHVAQRERRTPPRKSQGPKARVKTRTASTGAWLRGLGAAAALAALSAGYLVVADSATFAVSRVEVEGTSRLSPERVEEIVRKAAGQRLLGADLDAIRDAVAAESYVRSVSVVRVLPDGIRVRVEERQPSVVVRLRSGRFGWADSEGRLLEGYTPESGAKMPPPLTGFDEGDRSERAAADNRDRVERYGEIRAALEAGGLWDGVDEVDLRYPKDAKVMLVDTGLVVRLGDKNFADRFARAVRTLDAARRGDTDTLTGLNIRGTRLADLIARSQWIDYVDAADDSGRMTVAYSREAPPPSVEPAAPARDAEKPAAAPAVAAPKATAKPAEKPAAKQAPGSSPEARPRKVSETTEKRDTGRRN